MEPGYHDGELAMQAQAGTLAEGVRMARTIRSAIPDALMRFLLTQRWIILGALDDDGRMWASPLIGRAGFAAATDAATISIRWPPDSADPLCAIMARTEPSPVGLLAIDLSRRMRARINGPALAESGRLRIDVEECYSNCMKYIQRRDLQECDEQPRCGIATITDRIPPDQLAHIRTTDTLFIATCAPGRGADTSHRGGLPGFVECASDGSTLRFPDYPGNGMFNTLGNICVDERAAITIPDFDTGGVLQLTGTAHVVRHNRPPGSARMVEFTVAQAIQRPHAIPCSLGPVEYSAFCK